MVSGPLFKTTKGKVRVFIRVGGEHEKVANLFLFTKSVKSNRTELLPPRVDSKSRDLAIEKGFRASLKKNKRKSKGFILFGGGKHETKTKSINIEKVKRNLSNLGFRNSPQSYGVLSADPKQIKGFGLKNLEKHEKLNTTRKNNKNKS